MNKRQAFTLIELLIAIGVIGILIGMLVVGIQYVGASSRVKSTRITLENLQSMLAELENTGGLGRLPWRQAVPAPGAVVEGETDRTGAMVVQTRNAMAIILAVPANQAAISQLPPEQLFIFPHIGTQNINTPVLLDAWNNPILFVSPPNSSTATNAPDWDDRYGLIGVDIDGIASDIRVVNPGGADYPVNSRYPAESDTDRWQRLQHFRPFWVSAGPDGDFRTHDDNVYSFEN